MTEPIVGRIVSCFYKGYVDKPPRLYFAIRTVDDKKVFPDPVVGPRPYFYCRKQDLEEVERQLQLKGIRYDITEEPDKEFALLDGEVIKVEVFNPWHISGLKSTFRDMGIEICEADIIYERRVRIDKNIRNGILLVDGKMYPYYGELPKRKFLFVDIEVDDSNGFPEKAGDYAILCIGTVNDEGVSKFFTWNFKTKSEAEMLTEFFQYAKNYDGIVLWNANFDKEHIIQRCRKLGLWYEWRIFRWLDLAEFYRIHHQKTYWEKLPVAYSKVIKTYRRKLDELGIEYPESLERAKRYYTLWRTDMERLEKINTSHAYALYVIEKAMEILAMRGDVADEVGIFLDQTKWNSHIVDTYILRIIKEKNLKYVVNSSGRYSEEKGFRGAIVFSPKRGIHKYVHIYDFTSLYNRVIQGFLIDPIVYAKWDGTFSENGIEEYRKFAEKFAQKEGVELKGDNGKTIKLPLLPAILHELEIKRNFYKSQLKKYEHGSAKYEEYDAKQKSMKVILLACYGVMGMSSSRWSIKKKIPEDKILYITEENEDEMDFRIPAI